MVRFGLRFYDRVSDAFITTAARPGRTAVAGLGTAVSVAAVIVTFGLAATAGQQISSRFDAFRATQVIVTDSDHASEDSFLDKGSLDRMAGLNGIIVLGTFQVIEQNAEIAATERAAILSPRLVPVVAASAGGLEAAGVKVTGRSFDTGFDNRPAHVALVSRSVLADLGLPEETALRSAVLLQGVRCALIGVLEDARGRPDLMRSIVVPSSLAPMWVSPEKGPVEVFVKTVGGAAEMIGKQAPLALRPQDPQRATALVPPDPKDFRVGVERDLVIFGLVTGLVGLVVGAMMIGNASFVSVLERRSEIGVLRALGARRSDIAAQVLAEAGITAFLGGVVGACIGVVTVAVISAINGWTPILDLRLTSLAPLAASVTGAVAGLLPARRAAAVPPSVALRTAQ